MNVEAEKHLAESIAVLACTPAPAPTRRRWDDKAEWAKNRRLQQSRSKHPPVPPGSVPLKAAIFEVCDAMGVSFYNWKHRWNERGMPLRVLRRAGRRVDVDPNSIPEAIAWFERWKEQGGPRSDRGKRKTSRNPNAIERGERLKWILDWIAKHGSADRTDSSFVLAYAEHSKSEWSPGFRGKPSSAMLTDDLRTLARRGVIKRKLVSSETDGDVNPLTKSTRYEVFQ